MKILIIARGFPSPQDPQDGCFELDQAKALRTLGHDVTMMSVDCRLRWYWRKIGITHNHIEDIPTYKIFWFPTSLIRRVNYKWSSWIDKKAALCLFRKVQQECGSFDLMHAHFLPCIFHGAYIKKYYDIPLVGTEHWSELSPEVLKPYVAYLGHNTYSCVNSLITVCEPLRKNINQHFSKNSVVIHNMIGSEFIDLSFKSRDHSDRFRIIAMGSLIHRKGFDILISAFSISGLALQDAELVIIGEGPEHTNLQKQIDGLGLQQQISLLGRKSKTEIVDLLLSSKVYVSSSRSENFSVAVLEALSAGLPVIATICGGIKECIDDRNGLLVPVEDPERLAAAMKKMYEKYTIYDCESIRQDCLSKYAPEIIAKEVESVYIKVLNKNV